MDLQASASNIAQLGEQMTMARFVRTKNDRRMVNLDHVHMVEITYPKNKPHEYTLWGGTAEDPIRLGDTNEDPSYVTQLVVPAAPGTMVTVVAIYDDDEGENPDIRRYPVVAWYISDGFECAAPIWGINRSPDQNEYVLTELPDGRFFWSMQEYPDIESATKEVVEHYRRSERIRAERERKAAADASVSN